MDPVPTIACFVPKCKTCDIYGFVNSGSISIKLHLGRRADFSIAFEL